MSNGMRSRQDWESGGRRRSVIGRAAGLVSHIYEEKTNGNAVANAVIDVVNNVEYQDPA